VNIHEVEGLKASVETSEPAKHFDSVPGLVWAFRIHDDGAAEQLPIDQPIPILPGVDLAASRSRQCGGHAVDHSARSAAGCDHDAAVA
jgi:hypothetical protein